MEWVNPQSTRGKVAPTWGRNNKAFNALTPPVRQARGKAAPKVTGRNNKGFKKHIGRVH